MPRFTNLAGVTVEVDDETAKTLGPEWTEAGDAAEPDKSSPARQPRTAAKK